jgi:hypothetical protein
VVLQTETNDVDFESIDSEQLTETSASFYFLKIPVRKGNLFDDIGNTAIDENNINSSTVDKRYVSQSFALPVHFRYLQPHFLSAEHKSSFSSNSTTEGHIKVPTTLIRCSEAATGTCRDSTDADNVVGAATTGNAGRQHVTVQGTENAVCQQLAPVVWLYNTTRLGFKGNLHLYAESYGFINGRGFCLVQTFNNAQTYIPYKQIYSADPAQLYDVVCCNVVLVISTAVLLLSILCYKKMYS